MKQVNNTAPLTINTAEGLKRLSRKFLGDLFPKQPMGIKELKAYTKGQSRFRHGSDEQGNPLYYLVRQEYF